MGKFDRKVKKLSKEFQVPDSYHEKVDKILEEVHEDCVPAPRKRWLIRVAVIVLICGIFITGGLCLSDPGVAEASFFAAFKQTILDFFGMSEEESQEKGVESKKEEAVSEPDLMMEMQEVVMDEHNIYTMIKITASSEVKFKESMTFDYFGFCEGENYNVSNLMGGPKECRLLEIMPGKENIATYVVSITTEEEIAEGTDITVFFQDLISGEYEDAPEILVEGIWSLPFSATYTNSKEITVKGTEDMKFSFAGAKADIKKMKLTPLGLTINTDVTEVDDEKMRTEDTRFAVSLKMIDGRELFVYTLEEDAEFLSENSSAKESEKEGRIYLKHVYQFKEAIDISQVIGITIADYYAPLKDYK